MSKESGFKFNTNKKKNNIRQNIEFRKSKAKRSIDYFFKITIIVTFTITSGVLINAYVCDKDSKTIISKENAGINFKLETKKPINNKYLINNYNNAIETIQKGMVIVKSGKAQNLGIIFREDGYIVTSSDNLEDKKNIVIEFFNKEECRGKLLGQDNTSKIAVIKVDKNNLDTTSFDEDDNIKLGNEVIMLKGNDTRDNREFFIGKILSIEKKMCYGINSKNREKCLLNLIKTNILKEMDEKGNIFMYNENGKLIGVNFYLGSKLFSESTYNCLHAYEVEDIVENILNTGHNIIRDIGISGKSAISTTQNGAKGVYIQKVIKGGLGESAKIRPTDIIIGVNDKEIKDIEELHDTLVIHKKGEKLILKIWRNGKVIYNDISCNKLK